MTEGGAAGHSLYPLALLRDLADLATRDRILQGAASQLRRVKGRGYGNLLGALQNRIRGFRRAQDAAVPQLAKALQRFLFEHTAPTRDLIALWTESVEGLAGSVDDFLEAAVDQGGLRTLLSRPADDWKPEDLLALADRFLEGNPGHPRLAIAIVLGDHAWDLSQEIEDADEDDDDETSTDVDEAQKDSEPSELSQAREGNVPATIDVFTPGIEHRGDAAVPVLQSPRLVRFVEELDALPPGATEWDELPAFIAALGGARARAKERAAVLKAQAMERLRRLPEHHPEALSFVEYGGWFFDAGTPLEIRDPEAVQSACDALDQGLARLEGTLENRPTWSGLAEWQTRLNVLRDEVRAVLAQIEALVSPADRHAASGEPAAAPSETAPATVTASGEVAAPIGEQASAPHVSDRRDEASIASLESPPAAETRAGGETVVAVVAPLEQSTGEPGVMPTEAGPGVPAAEPETEVSAHVGTMSQLEREAVHVIAPLVTEGGVTITREGTEETALLCAMVSEGDLAGAYWLARSLSSIDPPLPLPDWLLAAAQASPWIAHGSDAFVPELLDLASTRQPTGTAEHLMALSVALKAAVMVPMTGLAAWLRPQDLPHGALRAVCEVVAEFATYNTALGPDDLRGLSGAAALDAAIRAVRTEARQSVETAEGRGAKMRRAHDVWIAFVRRELPSLLGPVAADDRDRVGAVRSTVERWRRAKDVQDWIDETDARLSHRTQQPIIADPRDQLLRRMRDCLEIARRWCELIERAVVARTRGSWLLERAKALQSAVGAALPRADAELFELSRPTRPVALVAAAVTLRRALAHLGTALQVPVRLAVELGAYDGRVLRAIEDSPDLERALAARLLWLPELELEIDGRPRRGTLPGVAEALQVAARESRTLVDAYRGWITKQDFRFAERLARVLPDDPVSIGVQDEMSRAREAAVAALRVEVVRTQEAIEQAVVDGIMADRSEYMARTEFDVSEVVEFGPHLASLALIRDGLDAARSARLAHSRERWRTMQTELAARFTGSRWLGVRDFVDALVARDDRALLECLERLEDVLKSGGELPEDWVTATPQRDVFAEFLANLSALEEMAKGGLAAVQRALRARGSAFRDFSDFPQPRLDEAHRALDDWIALKTGTWSASAITGRLGGILEFAGFTLAADVNRLAVVQDGPDWSHVRARMSASGLSPVPQFGSQARGLYDVLCVRERPGVDLLAARLREAQLEGHPVIVLYLARLVQSRRRELSRLTRRDDLSIVALDESLLLFLVGERDARLPVFLRCALPYSAVNPFTPALAGDVPPEMFFGRQDMVRELERPEGGCVVYGGRQLGKSALLRRVERDLHAPARGSYARVIGINLVGDPHAGIESYEIWHKIRDTLKDFGLLHARVSTDQPKEIIRHVRDVLKGRELRQVLLLFDEADAFLDTDARQGFRIVTELRDLMNESRRRLKVVFAGLQNVQRFEGIPNQPLAHFGQLPPVGPLEPDAAERLVREPFQALGYRFAESGVVLRVLSYTNYHPGLIQLFCQQLLRAHRSSAGLALPPYVIQAEDVERVYRQPVVRDSIRDRFGWTLALDPRYECTAWAMIVDQISDRGSYARPYSPREALALVQSWWSHGFADMNLDRYRAILGEMEGLGVLRRTAEGHYRLRSPNLVRLMGREADVEDRLVKLAERRDLPSFDVDSYRALLHTDSRSPQYGPMTHADARRVAPPRSGVSLLFGSRALGIDVVAESPERVLFGAGSERSVKVFSELASAGVDEDRLRGQLQRFALANQRQGRLAAVEVVAGGDRSIQRRVEAALRFCQERADRPGIAPFRLIFVFPPAPAWEWIHAGDMVDIESRIDAMTSLAPWNEAGLRRRLEQHDKIAADTHCRRLFEVTGGWPSLVDEVFQRCGGNSDIQPAVNDVQAEIDAGGSLAQGLLNGLGLDAVPGARAVLRFVHEWVPDQLLPELIDPSLTESECRAMVEWLSRMSLLISQGGRWTVDPLIARILPIA